MKISTGPWKQVFTSPEPFNTPLGVLVDAFNGYLPDPPDVTGFYSRPGFSLLNGGLPIYDPGGAFRGQAIYPHEMQDGSRLNFLVIGGHLFRVDAQLSTFTDVTPVGVVIDPSITTRVFFASLLDNLIATDGIHRPWVGTDLTSTPITGTYIDYDGLGVAWTAFGNPAVYLGAVWFILNSVGGVARRADVSYSEPGLPLSGYQQSGSDNNITLSTSNSGPLFALSSSNTALNYLRERSIGAIAGSDIGNIASSPTEDSIAFNVGTQAAQTIWQFGNAIYFCDAIGRPYVWTPGSPPRDIWKQMRGIVDAQTIGFPTTTSIVATAALEPTLNLYLAAIWSPEPGSQAAPLEAFIYDAPTGTYEGRWTIERDGEPIGIDCLGTFFDASGRPTLIVLETGGYAWSFNSLSTTPFFLTTEDDDFLTTEGGVGLTTEGVAAIWKDNGEIPNIEILTAHLGESDDKVINVDQVVVSTMNGAPIRVTVGTSMMAETVEGEPEPSQSQDDTYRLVVGADAMGRGPQITVKPLEAEEQWICQRVTMRGVVSVAGPEDA